MGQEDPPRKSVGQDADRPYQVETEESEVRQVVLRQRLVLEVRVQTPDAAKFLSPELERVEIGNDDLPVGPDDHGADGPAPIDEQADLARDLAGDFGQGAGQFRGDESGRRELPPVEALESCGLG